MRRFRSESGQSLVEFALASAIFFATVFGILELGLGVYRYNMIANLAQEGARWAAVHGSKSPSPAHLSDVRSFLTARASGLDMSVTTSSNGSSVDGPYALTSGTPITVVVTSNYMPMTGFIYRSTNIPLQATATMIVAR